MVIDVEQVTMRALAVNLRHAVNGLELSINPYDDPPLMADNANEQRIDSVGNTADTSTDSALTTIAGSQGEPKFLSRLRKQGLDLRRRDAQMLGDLLVREARALPDAYKAFPTREASKRTLRNFSVLGVRGWILHMTPPIRSS